MNAGKHVDDTRPLDDGEGAPRDGDVESQPTDGHEDTPAWADDGAAHPAVRTARRPHPVDDSHVLPSRSSDDLDTGWGDRPRGDDDERFLRDVPPHWGR